MNQEPQAQTDEFEIVDAQTYSRNPEEVLRGLQRGKRLVIRNTSGGVSMVMTTEAGRNLNAPDDF